jgi:release factor glutamine methyltransferase
VKPPLARRSNRSIRELLDEASAALSPNSETARLDAEVLLAFVLDRPRAHLRAWPERTLAPAEAERFLALVQRGARGEPVAYLTGHREFWSLDLLVTPAVLIPRPETERLVELALAAIPAGAPWRIADIGTGSGAVALALAGERPAARIVATEVSQAALAVARENARRLGIANVEWCCGDLCAPLAGERYDLIVSNPPYVAAADPHLAALRYEPPGALAAGADGLDVIRRLVLEARAHLTPGGMLLFEHGYDQGEAARGLLAAAGYHRMHTHQDAGGRDRVSDGRLPDAT